MLKKIWRISSVFLLPLWFLLLMVFGFKWSFSDYAVVILSYLVFCGVIFLGERINDFRRIKKENLELWDDIYAIHKKINLLGILERDFKPKEWDYHLEGLHWTAKFIRQIKWREGRDNKKVADISNKL